MAIVDSATIKQLALDLGFTTVGITPAAPVPQSIEAYRKWLEADFHADMAYLAEHEPLKQDPKTLLPGAKSLVVVTLNYYQDPPPNVKIARYALGRDYHKELRSRLKKLETTIKREHPDSQNRICVDSAPIMERAYAHMAGLGWFGKNTMLIDSKRGSWFFIGVLLTTLELEPDTPSEGGCGTCRLCIEACPTGAIVQLDGRWQVDSRSCISYQTIENRGELTVDTDGWVFGCDVCQEVCPFNQPRESQPLRATMTTIAAFRAREFPNSRQLATISEGDWNAITQGSAIRRAGLEGLKRNARNVL